VRPWPTRRPKPLPTQVRLTDCTSASNRRCGSSSECRLCEGEEHLPWRSFRLAWSLRGNPQTLRALAERFVDGRLSDEALAGMTDEEVEATLTEVSGIGLWTARGFLLVALDRPDVFLSGDLALRRAIQRAYGFDHLPTEDEVAQVSDRWLPYRSLAVSYLFASEYDAPP
jgi:hypothetical protein